MLFPIYTIIYDTILTDLSVPVKDGTNLEEEEQETSVVFVSKNQIFLVNFSIYEYINILYFTEKC